MNGDSAKFGATVSRARPSTPRLVLSSVPPRASVPMPCKFP